MIGGKKVKKKYISPELEILKALLTTDVLYASTGEDNVDDVGGQLPDEPSGEFGEFEDDDQSAETPDKELGDDWGIWW